MPKCEESHSVTNKHLVIHSSKSEFMSPQAQRSQRKQFVWNSAVIWHVTLHKKPTKMSGRGSMHWNTTRIRNRFSGILFLGAAVEWKKKTYLMTPAFLMTKPTLWNFKAATEESEYLLRGRNSSIWQQRFLFFLTKFTEPYLKNTTALTTGQLLILR